jgi:hypothetical protein
MIQHLDFTNFDDARTVFHSGGIQESSFNNRVQLRATPLFYFVLRAEQNRRGGFLSRIAYNLVSYLSVSIHSFIKSVFNDSEISRHCNFYGLKAITNAPRLNSPHFIVINHRKENYHT